MSCLRHGFVIRHRYHKPQMCINLSKQCGEVMKKNEVFNVLKSSLAKVDGMKFLLVHEDLIWRMAPNAHSVQALLKDMIDAEQQLWSVLLPGCLESRQRRVFQHRLRERNRYWKENDGRHGVFNQFLSNRRITLLLLEDLAGNIGDKDAPDGIEEGAVIEKVDRLIERQDRCLSMIGGILSERFEAMKKSAV